MNWLKRASRYMSLEERFERSIFYSPDGCWYWIGYVALTGYGAIGKNYVLTGAQRIGNIYENN